MLGWVYRAALACPQLDQVLIATDSKEVTDYADSQGWPSIMTSTTLASGTDRVHAVAAIVDADIYVNIQGDEPLIRREHIDALLRPFAQTGAEVTTLSTLCSPEPVSYTHLDVYKRQVQPFPACWRAHRCGHPGTFGLGPAAG